MEDGLDKSLGNFRRDFVWENMNGCSESAILGLYCNK